MANVTSPAHLSHFYREAPVLEDADGTRHWITRGANFVVVATEAKAGATLVRTAENQQDEYMVLLPEEVGCEVTAGQDSVRSAGDGLIIVPPGDSVLIMPEGGWVYRVFSKLSEDLLARAVNADDYAGSVPFVADLVTWPEPVGGYKLRCYDLDKYVRSDTTMRLFRTRHLMINVFLPNKAPRDILKLSPHSHADFEQGSLAIRGAYIHHMRYPWTPDQTTWRDDEHLVASTPSLLIIPPQVVHTSQSVGNAGMRLVDIFAPPREDFSLKPGLVCNADEYPLPAELTEK